MVIDGPVKARIRTKRITVVFIFIVDILLAPEVSTVLLLLLMTHLLALDRRQVLLVDRSHVGVARHWILFIKAFGW